MGSKTLKRKVFEGLFWKFSERITAQLVSLIVSIILARLLSPADYGEIALVMIFISIANVFVTNGLGTALVQKKDADALDYSSVLYINFSFSIVIYALIFIFAPVIADFYQSPVLCQVVRVLGLRIVLASINSVQQAYVSKQMLFKKFFWATLFGTVISGVIGIALAYRNYGIWALVIQYITNTFVDTIVLAMTIRWKPILKCSWRRAKSLIAYGWKLLVAAIVDTGYSQLRSLIIGKVYTAEDLAFYNQGDKYPSLVVTNINSSISSVLFPAMSQYQNDPMKIKQMVRKSIQISSFFMWPLMIGLCVIAEPMISMLLTDKWLPCVPYLRILCLSYGMWPIHTANLQAVNAIGRSDLFLKLEVIKKILGLFLLLISIKHGVIAIALSLLITGMISTLINAFPNRKLINYSYFEQMKDLLPPFIISVIMGMIIYPINGLNIFVLIKLLLQISLGAIVYFLIAMVLKMPAFLFVIDFIKKRR